MIPIELVNMILYYFAKLKNDIIIIQYNLITNKEFYKINFNSNLLWKIKAVFVMKRFYPIYSGIFSKNNIELYNHGIKHYENELRLENK